MPQKLAIDRSMPLTADGFMKLAGRYSRKNREEALARAEISGLAQSQLADLSGGELQRVLMARALLRQPNLLVLDEPTQGLDQPGEAAFYNLIERVRRETGTAVLMASHDLHVVMSTSDRVICLNGHVCCEGAPDFVSESPEYRALFGRGTDGALALYRHDHDHHHHHRDHDHDDNSAGERA
jgi:zinc transport system ATP-binding protein